MGDYIVLVVDSVIAGGKAVYLNAMKECLEKREYTVTLIKENVDKWNKRTNSDEPSLFELFNKDRKRWAYHFQTRVFVDRVKQNQEEFQKWKSFLYAANKVNNNSNDYKPHIFILERFCSTDRLFMDTLYEGGFVTDMEMTDYKEWADMWQSVMPYTPDLFIYLDLPVELAMKRLKERNRKGEEEIDEGYQKLLKEKHDNFFKDEYVKLSSCNKIINVPRIIISSVENYRDDSEIKEKKCDELESEIKRIISKRKDNLSVNNKSYCVTQ